MAICTERYEGGKPYETAYIEGLRCKPLTTEGLPEAPPPPKSDAFFKSHATMEPGI